MTEQDGSGAIPVPEGTSAIIDTDYTIGQDNVEGQLGPFGFDVHNPVFMVSGLSIVAFVFYALALPEQASTFFGWLRPALPWISGDCAATPVTSTRRCSGCSTGWRPAGWTATT